MWKSHGLYAVVVALIVTSLSPAKADGYIEDFTTTTFRDSANTTAWWDTDLGELKLFPFEITLAGSYDTPGSAVGVFVSGDYAYVADLVPGLQVIDISDPANPTLAGSYNTPGDARDVFVSGDHAYVADAASGLQVIDISDPTNPAPAGGCDTPGSARGVFVSGDHAYVADTASGLQVIDISDPTNPVAAGAYDTPGSASGVFVSGNFAYVADEGSGLQVIDISDPTNPVSAGSYDTPNIAWGVFVFGDHAYVADGSSGLQVIDISDPTSPVLAGSYDTPGSARDVFVSGDHVCVADWDSGLQVIDVTDPTNPTLVMSQDTPGTATGIFLWGEQAYVGDGSSGLQVIDRSDPAELEQVGSWSITSGRSAVVAGDHAYVAAYNDGLEVVDVSDPANPAVVGTYDTGRATDVEVSGDHAYVADILNGLQVVDVSDPANPTLVGTYGALNPRGVDIAGDRAYVAGAVGGLRVIDIQDPTNPNEIGFYNTSGDAYGVEVAGDRAYVADRGSGLQIIDISDPTSPVLLGSYDTPGDAVAVTVSGDYAYIADRESGLQIIDVRDPTSPQLAGSYATSGVAEDVVVSGDDAYVAAGRLLLIDVSDPTDPILFDRYELTGTTYGCTVWGYHACVVYNGYGRVIKVRQHEFDTRDNRGQSTPLNSLSETIVKVRVNATQQAEVDWELNAGLGWQMISMSSSWRSLDFPGPSLRWRSTHRLREAGVNPGVSQLQIEWLYEFAAVNTIEDVPGDQGGWVRLEFTRSGHDFVDEETQPVTGYQIYQRVDDPALQERVLSEATTVRVSEPMGSESPWALLDSSRLRTLGERRFVVGSGEAMAGEFPPGIWEAVAWVAALQQDTYTARIPTTADSTEAGMHWSVYLTTTHTTIPSVWFVSPPDSGYSVDNIAPSAPSGLAHADGVLSWNESPDEDFNYFTVYGGDTDDFDQSEFIGYTVETAYDVSASPFNWYFVTAKDHAGNESDPAGVEAESSGIVLDTQVLPAAYALREASPNPFTRETVLSFDLPSPTKSRLDIYDVSGRLIRTLVQGDLPAGRHRCLWRGRNARGEVASPGVYFVRFESGDFKATRKLLRLR